MDYNMGINLGIGSRHRVDQNLWLAGRAGCRGTWLLIPDERMSQNIEQMWWCIVITGKKETNHIIYLCVFNPFLYIKWAKQIFQMVAVILRDWFSIYIKMRFFACPKLLLLTLWLIWSLQLALTCYFCKYIHFKVNTCVTSYIKLL